MASVLSARRQIPHNLMKILDSQRHLFDIPAEVAYFNCAYNAPQLNASRERLLDGARRKSHPWTRKAVDFFAETEAVRAAAAGALGGDVDGWAVVPASSYGMSTAARAVEPTLGPNDIILVAAEEFPSLVLPWRRTAASTGAALQTLPWPADNDWTAAWLAAVRPGVRVVATSPCHWTNGSKLDLAAIGETCRRVGAVLAVDATQSLGAMPLHIERCQPDFLVASGYKWLLCPYGFSLLYVGPRFRDARPLEESWLGRQGAEDFAGLVRYSDRYRVGARRFDVGENCVPTLLPGALAALEQLGHWGVDNVAASLASINQRIVDGLEPLGFGFPGIDQRCPHIVGASLPPGMSGAALVQSLQSESIFVSQRGDAVRFAPHLHVDEHDITRLIEATERAADVAAGRGSR